MTLKSLLEAKDQQYVYYCKGELWLSYGQGSGQTAQLPDTSKFLNSDSSDKEHYDSLVVKISEASQNGLLTNKTLKSKSNKTLYELPSYPLPNGINNYTIWGGTIEPLKQMYMIITDEKSTIINIFDNEKEAIKWID